MRLLDFDVDDDTRTVSVVRDAAIDGLDTAVVGRYDGRSVSAWQSAGPWNATLWQNESVTGFAPRRPLTEERVSLGKRIALMSANPAVLAPRAQAQAQRDCAAWMTGGQCAQVTAPDLTASAIAKFRSTVFGNGNGEPCFDDGSMCAHSVQECTDFWVYCDAAGGNTRPMNCTIDYCSYNACYEWDCAQDRQKMCCPEGEPVTTTSVFSCM
jgi:hypothetical protein